MRKAYGNLPERHIKTYIYIYIYTVALLLLVNFLEISAKLSIWAPWLSQPPAGSFWLLLFQGLTNNPPQQPCYLFSSIFDVFVQPVFKLPNPTFLPKVSKSDSKREPKGNQQSPKLKLFDLSKHVVITI